MTCHSAHTPLLRAGYSPSVFKQINKKSKKGELHATYTDSISSACLFVKLSVHLTICLMSFCPSVTSNGKPCIPVCLCVVFNFLCVCHCLSLCLSGPVFVTVCLCFSLFYISFSFPFPFFVFFKHMACPSLCLSVCLLFTFSKLVSRMDVLSTIILIFTFVLRLPLYLLISLTLSVYVSQSVIRPVFFKSIYLPAKLAACLSFYLFFSLLM